MQRQTGRARTYALVVPVPDGISHDSVRVLYNNQAYSEPCQISDVGLLPSVVLQALGGLVHLSALAGHLDGPRRVEKSTANHLQSSSRSTVCCPLRCAAFFSLWLGLLPRAGFATFSFAFHVFSSSCLPQNPATPRTTVLWPRRHARKRGRSALFFGLVFSPFFSAKGFLLACFSRLFLVCTRRNLLGTASTGAGQA